MSCKWLLFLLHHAFCWKATRFNGGLQRGCLPVPHRGLCAVTLRVLSHCKEGEGGVRVGFTEERVGGGALAANSMNPPGLLAVVRHPPTFSTFLLSFHSLCSFTLAPSLTKLDPGTTGPSPRTGVSPLAYRELPPRSPDAVMARTEKTRPLKDRAPAFLGGFLPLCVCVSVCVKKGNSL